MISELIESGLVGVVLGGLGVRLLSFATSNAKPNKFDGAYAWKQLFRAGDSNVEAKLCCPKCKRHYDYCKQMDKTPLCQCHEYHSEHFHWTCPGCKATILMRTADQS